MLVREVVGCFAEAMGGAITGGTADTSCCGIRQTVAGCCVVDAVCEEEVWKSAKSSSSSLKRFCACGNVLDRPPNDGGGGRRGGGADGWAEPLIIIGVALRVRGGGSRMNGEGVRVALVFKGAIRLLRAAFGYNCARGTSPREDEDEEEERGGGIGKPDGGGMCICNGIFGCNFRLPLLFLDESNEEGSGTMLCRGDADGVCGRDNGADER